MFYAQSTSTMLQTVQPNQTKLDHKDRLHEKRRKKKGRDKRDEWPQSVTQSVNYIKFTGRQDEREEEWDTQTIYKKVREPQSAIVQELCVRVEVAVLSCLHPNEPSGFRGRKELLNRASALVTICP